MILKERKLSNSFKLLKVGGLYMYKYGWGVASENPWLIQVQTSGGSLV
jgi:hypothetical protein